jgi:dolichol-phosphate mannosyltransferase
VGGWMLFIPMYNCGPQIVRTLGQLGPEMRDRFVDVLVVDNGSTDGGPEAARAFARDHLADWPVRVVRNDQNYGLGGSHKVAFREALDRGLDGVVVFHGDDQGRLADLLGAIEQFPDAECVLGARFMTRSRLVGYAPHRIAANIIFNLVFSAASGRMLWDLGSGLNAYRRAFLERELWETCADNLTFNYHLILRTTRVPESRMAFWPISWREEDQVSNAKLWSHGVEMLRILHRFFMDPAGFCSTDFRTTPHPRTFTVIR